MSPFSETENFHDHQCEIVSLYYAIGPENLEMPPTAEDSVRVVQTENTVTVADSVKIVMETQKSPTKVKVSKTKTPSGKISM